MFARLQFPTISARALGITLGAWMLVALATACGSTTPTSALPAPSAAAAASPGSAQPSVPVAPSPGAPASTSVTPTEVPTKVAFAVTLTPEAAARLTATTAPPPKPSAPTGKFTYTVVTGNEPKFFTIWVANANGSNPRQILTHAQWPTFSPDGRQIAYFGRPEGGSAGLYIANSDGGGVIGPLVVSPGVCCMNWSRDGTWIVYTNSPRASQPGGPISMIKMDGAYKTTVSLGVEGNGPTFSPNEQFIVYSGCPPNTSTCGLIVVPASGGAPRQLTKDNGGNADWSPHGDKIVYQAVDEGGHLQVYVVNTDGSGKKALTHGRSNDGQPVWSRDGGSVFWRSDQNGTAWAIYVMNADGSNARKLIDNAVPNQDLWGWESLSVAP
jgi:Tol biopolymer transport system component